MVIPPNFDAINWYRMCILWNTTIKKSSCLQIDCVGMPPLYFTLKWATSVGHCFHPGNIGHLMVECPQKATSRKTSIFKAVQQDVLCKNKPQALPMVEAIGEHLQEEIHLHNPWNKHINVQEEAITSLYFPSHQNLYTILGEFLQDIVGKIAMKEQEIPRPNGKNKYEDSIMGYKKDGFSI